MLWYFRLIVTLKVQLSQKCIEGAEKLQLCEDKAEDQEIRRRKTNVIAHRLLESDADTLKERIESDIVQVVLMLDELGVTGANVNHVIRLRKNSQMLQEQPNRDYSRLSLTQNSTK